MSVTRRHFCKIFGLSVLGLSAAPLPALAATERFTMSGQCRIEVLRCECFDDIQGRYLNDPEAGRCKHFKVGDTILVTPDNFARFDAGKGICPKAWSVLRPYALAALTDSHIDACAPAAANAEAIVCCPDGTRPVLFKVSKA